MKRGYNCVVRAGGVLALAGIFAIGAQAFTVTATAACSNGQNGSGCKSVATAEAPEASFEVFLGGLDLLVDALVLVLP